MKSLVALTAVVALAVGCGNASTVGFPHLSKAAYEAKVETVGVQLVKDYRSAYATAQGSTPEKVARQVKSAYDRAASKLDALKPPSNAAADNAKLASGLRAWGAYQSETVVVSTAITPALGKRLTHSSAYRNLFAGIHDLQHEGYKLGILTDRFFVGS